MKFLLLALIISFLISSCFAEKENTTLLLVQTIFRHGDRAPKFLYKNDLNSADIWINGLGQLTQLGKNQLYAVGKYLRSWYNDFVTSDPNQIIVNSGSQVRCLNSVEAFLASFYPPDEKWKFMNDFNWQPIPIGYIKRRKNIYLDHRTLCPQIKHETEKTLKSKTMQKFYQAKKTVIEHLSNLSGLDLFKPINCYHLFNTLTVERLHNLTTPDWVESYWEDLNFLGNAVFDSTYGSPVALRLGYGPFLGQLTDTLKKKINGSTPDLKFVINSSHGVNVGGVLRVLNFTNLPIPPFGSTLLFELHKMVDASMTVRILYMNSTNPAVHIEEPHVLVLDSCTEFCPVDYFMKSYQWLVPDNWEEECKFETKVTYEASGSQLRSRPIFEKYLYFIIYLFSFYFYFS